MQTLLTAGAHPTGAPLKAQHGPTGLGVIAKTLTEFYYEHEQRLPDLIRVSPEIHRQVRQSFNRPCIGPVTIICSARLSGLAAEAATLPEEAFEYGNEH